MTDVQRPGCKKTPAHTYRKQSTKLRERFWLHRVSIQLLLFKISSDVAITSNILVLVMHQIGTLSVKLPAQAALSSH